MKNIFPFLLFFCLIFSSLLHASSENIVTFKPPSGFLKAENKELPPLVKVLLVGKGSYTFPPSINVAIDKHSGTLKDYLKIVKQLNESENAPFWDLGWIETQSGKASLSQTEMMTEWGEIRLMHAIMQKEDNVVIFTASALKKEFNVFFKIFIDTIKSLKINENEDPQAISSL